jgi:hypothetical protein
LRLSQVDFCGLGVEYLSGVEGFTQSAQNERNAKSAKEERKMEKGKKEI